ncbi:alpha/beta hydrolase [Corynebacterium camporealensis]
MFEPFDGTQLFLNTDEVDKAKAAVLIVHGLCEHQGRYDHVAAALNDAGYTTVRFDHRGHGKSEGDRAFYNDFNELVDDVNVVFDYTKETFNLPTYVIGHSMGGFASTLFGTKYPDKPAGIVLSGALTRYNAKIMGYLPIPGDPHSYVPNTLSEGVCSDPKVVEAYVNDPLVVKEVSIGLGNALGAGVDYLKANPQQFVAPALILHGLKDGLVSELDSRQLFDEIASEDKALTIYPQMMHEIFNEYDKDWPINDAIRWLNKHAD